MTPLHIDLLPDPGGVISQLVHEADFSRRQRLYRKVDKRLELIQSLKAEVDHYKDKDSSRALHLGTCALELSAFTNHPDAKPLGLWAYALGLTVQGQFDEALSYFEKARGFFHVQEREGEAARVAMRQIQALAMMGAFEEAIELAESTRSTLYDYGYVQDALTVENNMGIIYTRLGQVTQAESVLEHALAGFDAIRDLSGKVLVYINLGNLCRRQDRFVKTEQCYQDALELAQNLGQHNHVAGTTVNLALLYRRMGRHREALNLLSRARKLYENLPAGPDAALAQLEEARIHLDVNLLSEAITIASELVEVFGAKEMTLEQNEALQVLGLAQARKGELSDARATLSAARKKWCVMGNKVQTAITDLSIASLDLELGQVAWAKALALKAASELEAVGTRSGQMLAYLLCADILLTQEQLGEAQTYLTRAERYDDQLSMPDLSFRVAYLKGKLALEQNHLKDARTYFEEATGYLESVQGALPVADFRAAYMGDKLAVYETMIALLARQNDLAGVFNFIERAKSRALLNLLGSDINIPSSDPQISDITEKLKQARETLNWHSSGVEQNREQMLESEHEVTRLMRELERLAPETAAFDTTRIPKLAELQAQLDNKTVWIEYFSLQGVLSALVITHTEVTYHQNLALQSDIHQAFEWLEFYFNRSALGEDFVKAYGEERLNTLINETLQKLYTYLVAPLTLDTKAKTLMVSPHGPIYNVPFAALFDGQAYLGDSFHVTLTPSASVYLHSKQLARHRFKHRSKYQSQYRDGGAAASLVAFGMRKDLPAVQDELKAITAQVKEASLYLDDAATLETFLRVAPRATVVHIATHGQFRFDNPTFSSLTLQDGGLTPRDLYAMRLEASLVVLSACQSGRVGGFYGDDLVGLARGFLDAGASALVSTLWPTKDEQTAQFMTYFYKGLGEGSTIAHALEQAQRALRADYPNPYYWAAFTVIGDSGSHLDFGVLEGADPLPEPDIS